MAKQSPEILEVKTQRVEEMLDRAADKLREDDAELMRRIVESYSYITELVEDKNTSIARLRKLFFGAKTESSQNVMADAEQDDSASTPDDASSHESDDLQSEDQEEADPPPGHGRHSADDYPGARQVEVPHPTLAPGDACPDCHRGTLYEKSPKVLVRFVGQAPVQATVYRMQRLRCCLCDKIFSAPAPEAAGEQKYDHTVASMIGLLKYGSGLPFNRLERLQGNCQIPLAASTQWDVVHAATEFVGPAYRELVCQAAQGEVVYNDDTTARILELMGQRAEKAPVEEEEDPKRTGLFTSGVVATRAGVQIALFFSGRRHAGENLSEVLKLRAEDLDAPLQMCDGLSRNLPKELETILANCMAHGRRKFVEIYDRFSEECRRVIKALKVVYRNDKVAREADMSPEERLAHHQAHSKPVMDDLRLWLQRQFDEKLVEPNSALGEAIAYLLNRWEPLTLFLRKAGAPLDNNLCERALKKAILHRKNAMFFKTRNGALVGDMYMSLIYTCELNGACAFDYLNQLQLHAAEVAREPDQWMPWNYAENREAEPAIA